MENYSTICDATTMLFQSGNMGRIQLEDSCFCILIGTIPGTTNLLSYILRGQFKTHQEYLDFGMRS
jgi:hypothetical protein